MDVSAYLRCFESRVSSYTGEDPLDPWDRFVEYLEETFPAEDDRGMSLVFDSLVQRFVNDERYTNDVRYVKHCIKYASFNSEPVALYSLMYSRGVGTRSAAFYTAWAQQLERRGMSEQAEAVFQKALENQAQPADSVLHEYRQFQTRTRSQTTQSAAGHGPLQISHLTNQMPQREAAAQAAVDCPVNPPALRTVFTVSRSETSAALPVGCSSGAHTVPAYMKDKLVCEGSELSFEEVRAQLYFSALHRRQRKEQRENKERKVWEMEEAIRNIQSQLDKVSEERRACGGLTSQALSQKGKEDAAADHGTTANPPPSRHSSGRPPPSRQLSSRHSLGLRLHSEPTFALWSGAERLQLHSSPDASLQPPAFADRAGPAPPSLAPVAPPPLSTQMLASFDRMNSRLQEPTEVSGDVLPLDDQRSERRGPPPPPHLATCVDGSQPAEEKLNVSQGATAMTPNTSLGFVQATPSRPLPSPTVNTREALDVIMDMFQAPTLLDDPFHASTRDQAIDRSIGFTGGVCVSDKPAAPFTIFQDDTDKENSCSAASVSSSKLPRALAEIPLLKPQKPNDTPPDLMPDESTMWGARYNSLHSLAACPNSTTDFAMSAQCVSTPFTYKTPSAHVAPFTFFEDPDTNSGGGDTGDCAFAPRPTKQLSPIMEQSPPEEKLSESSVGQLVPSSAAQGTIIGEGLAAAQHHLTTSSVTMAQPAVLSFRDQTLCVQDPSLSRTSGPSWQVYTSPEKLQESSPETQHPPPKDPFTVMEDHDLTPLPESPECALRPDWLRISSPEVPQELDPLLSLCQLQTGGRARPAPVLDVPMSPEPSRLCVDVLMSPPPSLGAADEPMTSPVRSPGADVSKDGRVSLISDPWDDQLIADLLAALDPPLAAHPHCVSWTCSIPNITPKMTISMGAVSLRVDCVLGQGAFATVYQASNPQTSDKMVLKVQKPANPWEFYIITQLDARLPAHRRHQFSRIQSAHLFDNGSVLLGELHNYGTLLNAINAYRALSDKVMPQPLVMYFTVCILHMVEQLHAVNIVHADIKPDNFMFGERFLEDTCWDMDAVDHGLVLIDLGQSIDMQRFPPGAAFTAKCLTSGFQCTEMLSGRPWNYQTDYFGVAGTVYCMLFGTYMQVVQEGGVWKTNATFRRNPHGDLWLHFFHTLLNVPACDRLPSLTLLRHQLASVLQQNYGNKLSALKSRLVVQLLERRRAAHR